MAARAPFPTTRGLTVLRLSYWACALFELLAIVPMLSPTLFGLAMGIPDFRPGSDYRYAMGIAAVLTSGWVLLLVWADRKPVERRAVLAITVPVFVGNMVGGIYAVSSGWIAATTMLPSLIAQTILTVLLVIGYREAARIARASALRMA